MRSFCDSWSSRSDPSTDVVAVAMVCLDWAEDGRGERLEEGGRELIGESNKKGKRLARAQIPDLLDDRLRR